MGMACHPFQLALASSSYACEEQGMGYMLSPRGRHTVCSGVNQGTLGTQSGVSSCQCQWSTMFSEL